MGALEHEPRPSVILLDYRLPDVEGFGLLSGILARAPCVRVILMTACDDRDLPGQALACGAYAVLHKPFDLDRAVMLVARAGTMCTH